MLNFKKKKTLKTYFTFPLNKVEKKAVSEIIYLFKKINGLTKLPHYLHASEISQAREKHHFLIDNKIISSTMYRQKTFHPNLRSLSLLSPHKLVRCMCHKLRSLKKNIWEDNKQGVTKRWWFVKIIKQPSFGLQKFLQ